MAPITDDTVAALRDTISTLESRVHQLEAKLAGAGGNESNTAGSHQSIRMVLIGPPGAGKTKDTRLFVFAYI